MIDGKLLDLSHYDQGTFDEHCLAASGVKRVILGTTRRDVTEGQITACHSAGIEVVGLYGLIYYGGGGYVERDVRNAIALRGYYGIPWFAMDSEIDACDVDSFGQFGFPRPTVAQRQAETQRVRAMAEDAGFKVMTYTGGWWWTAQMGNTTAHADTPLWYANYGSNNPSSPIRPIEGVNFGGWRAVSIHQYSSTIPVCGRVRDHNYYLIPLEGNDEMSARDVERIDRLERLIGGNGIDIRVVGKPEPQRIKGEDALAYLDSIGWSAKLAVDNLNNEVKGLQGGLTLDAFERAMRAAIEEAHTLDNPKEEVTTL